MIWRLPEKSFWDVIRVRSARWQEQHNGNMKSKVILDTAGRNSSGSVSYCESKLRTQSRGQVWRLRNTGVEVLRILKVSNGSSIWFAARLAAMERVKLHTAWHEQHGLVSSIVGSIDLHTLISNQRQMALVGAP